MERVKLENSIVSSFTLLSQIHVVVLSMKTYFRIINDGNETSHIFDREKSKHVIPQLRKVELIIEDFPFSEMTNKQYCLQLVKQIQSYYEKYDVVVVKPESHAPPWLANKSRTNS